MNNFRLTALNRSRLVIGGVLLLSLVATVWSTLLTIRSADLNKRNTVELLPLLERAQDFEREILNARISFIYHVTINKTGSLEQGTRRFHQAREALLDLHALSKTNSRNGLLTPQLEALDSAWSAYDRRLGSILSLVQGGTRSGPAYDEAVAEWAADGGALVNAARDLVKTAASLSRAQGDQTGDMLRVSTWIICANGAFCLVSSLLLAINLREREHPHSAASKTQNSTRRNADEPSWSYLVSPFRAVRASSKNFSALGGMLLLIVVVLGTGFAALMGISRLRSAQGDTLQSHRILLDAETLRASTLAVDSDTRGFVFSGRGILFISQQTEMRHAWQLVDRLSRESQQDIAQEARLGQLRTVLQERFDSLNQISGIRVRSGPAAVSSLLAASQNLFAKRDLQELLDSYESAEYQRIVTGTLRGERAAAMSKTLILFAALPAALTLTLISFAMAHLLSRGKVLQEQLSHQASHDLLTGLPNRLMLSNRLQELIYQSRNRKTCFAVLGIDLDRFKEVNDRFGHHEGDTFLKEVANRFSAATRGSDTLIRIGGDEFLCLVEAVHDAADAEVVAQKLLSSLAEPIKLTRGLVKANASIGIAVFPQHGDSVELITKRADQALYQAKEGGRCQVRAFEEDDAHTRSQLIEECLATALEENHFRLVYQPQYTAEGHLRGFEALLRLTHPSLGAVSPAEFIPLAERNRLIVPIGAWVMKKACTTFASWIASGFEPGLISINVSAAQFASSGFKQTVVETLLEAGLPACRLELELTESMVMVDPAEATRQMQMLASSGIRLAIDDFGTGYSSLGHLNRLPISTLKIDRIFVQDLADGTTSHPIVQAIVALGKALSMEIIAEGVETEAQRLCLSSIGCNNFQGFLFARPLEEEAAYHLLQPSRHAERAKFQPEATLALCHAI